MIVKKLDRRPKLDRRLEIPHHHHDCQKDRRASRVAHFAVDEGRALTTLKLRSFQMADVSFAFEQKTTDRTFANRSLKQGARDVPPAAFPAWHYVPDLHVVAQMLVVERQPFLQTSQNMHRRYRTRARS